MLTASLYFKGFCTDWPARTNLLDFYFGLLYALVTAEHCHGRNRKARRSPPGEMYKLNLRLAWSLSSIVLYCLFRFSYQPYVDAFETSRV